MSDDRQAALEAIATELRYQNAVLVETVGALDDLAARVDGRHVPATEPRSRSGIALQTAIADRLCERADLEDGSLSGLSLAENWVNASEADPGNDGDAVVTASGGAEVFADEPRETRVSVSGYPEGVGLALSNEIGRVRALLCPDDVDSLCEELLAAKAETDAETVARVRGPLADEASAGDGGDGE